MKPVEGHVARGSTLDRLTNVVLLVGVAAVVVVNLTREVGPQLPEPPGGPDPQRATLQGERLPDSLWSRIKDAGQLRGSGEAPVLIAQFMDFECPFCRALHVSLVRLLPEAPHVATRLIHYPLARHRLARHAARAAECAARQHGFDAYTDLLFAKQDSLGVVPFRTLAIEARIADVSAFDACLSENTPVDEIEAGIHLGDQVGVRGTPTVIVNGWRLNRPPTESEIRVLVERALAGKPPVPLAQ